MLKKSKKLFLFYNTIKYLRFSQIWFRLYYSVLKLKLDLQISLTRRIWSNPWSAPLRATAPTILNLNTVCCLGETGTVQKPQDWNNKNKSKLWLYNLHYLDDLNNNLAVDHNLLNKFIEKWINENPPNRGNGWEPYPLSLRLVNLVKWYSSNKSVINIATINSLTLQAQALSKLIEYHIGGNHLFVNGKALIFIGAFFAGEVANQWLNLGLKILDQEIDEQFLNDGGHFELSPMYHANLLWDLCDLVYLVDCTRLSELLNRRKLWVEKIRKGYSWLKLMSHPDGEISFFNDAAFDIAPKIYEIEQYLKILDIKINLQSKYFTHLKESGYAIVQFNEATKAILDIGQIGPDYQPGHAHADTLSFELSINGQRVLVNSGTSVYGNGPERQRQRSTLAHNTVNINNENSSEVWGGFRVARRAYPKDLIIREDTNKVEIACSHTGYKRLKNKNIHRREFSCEDNSLVIHDIISGHCEKAEARFHFHPDIELEILDKNYVQCKHKKLKLLIEINNAESIDVISSTWHPYFGANIENKCLVVGFESNELFTKLTWQN